MQKWCHLHTCNITCHWSPMNPVLLFLVQNTCGSHKTWLLLELQWYMPIQDHDILPFLISSCPHDNDFWSSNTHLLGSPPNHAHCGTPLHYIGIKNIVYYFINTWKRVSMVNYNFVLFFFSIFFIMFTKMPVHIHKHSYNLRGNTITSQGMDSYV